MSGAPQRLRCEFNTNPLGVVAHAPRFSWWVSDPRPAEIQSAYEILVASEKALLDSDHGDLWHSGQVHSQENAHVQYEGVALAPGQQVWWKVRTFDSDGLTSPWSDLAHFQMGLDAEQETWPGFWMSTAVAGSRSQAVQVAAIRREFEARECVGASLYVAALGAYTLSVNGEALLETGAVPMWSDFDQDVYYQTYDISQQLKDGLNAIGILLGDGYFAGELPQVGRCAYGDKPKLRCLIELRRMDGSREVIASDHRWHWHTGWIMSAELNGSEHLDRRQIPTGWDQPHFDESAWTVVELESEPTGPYRSQPYVTASSLDRFQPLGQSVLHKSISSQPYADTRNGSIDYDFGGTLVGRVSLRLKSKFSDDVRIHYSLTPEFDEVQFDSCTTRGSEDGSVGIEVFEPQFAIHSFRYLRIEFGWGRTEIEAVNALQVSYPQSQGLHFKSDHETLNQLVEVLNKSINAVALTVPMRGVSPEHRLPDVAYAKTWMPRLAEEERAHALILKWLADMATALNQQYMGEHPASPYMPTLSQFRLDGYSDEMACYETFVQTLWSLYRHQDDRKVLEQYYDHIRVGALAYRHTSSGLLRQNPYKDLYGSGGQAVLVSTCESYTAIRLAARIASLLGFMGDHELLDNLARETKKAWRHRFVTPSGHLAADNQSVYVAALYHHMLEPEEEPAAAARLIELLNESRFHADVIPGVMRALLPTLTSIGRLDLAYMALLQTSQPSWLGNISAGELLVGRVPGDFDIADIGLLEWLVQSVVGISVDPDYSLDCNGFRKVRIQPHPPFGPQFLAGSPVTRLDASLQSLQGVFTVSWEIGASAFRLEVVIPPGCLGVVRMPDGIDHEVRSGRHKFVMDFNAGGDGLPLLVDVG